MNEKLNQRPVIAVIGAAQCTAAEEVQAAYVGRLLAAWISGHTSDKVGRERVMLVTAMANECSW